jgi:signal transduction histidine kinase
LNTRRQNLAVDAAVVTGFFLAALPSSWTWRSDWGPGAALAIALPLAGRRYWPLTCFAAQLIALGLSGTPAGAPPTVTLAIAVGAYHAVGVSGRWPRIAAGAGAVCVTMLIHFSGRAGSSVLLLLSVWLLAAALRALWLRSEAAEQYADTLAREHLAERRLAVELERARIARELHDALGHNVSVMMIQAGAARQAVAGPEAARTALLEVEAAGRQAMSELRHLLALLGPDRDRDGGEPEDHPDEDDPDELAPQPGLLLLDPLLDRIRAAGLPVSLSTRGPVRPLERGVDLAAYRVIQEGLTNALKYAVGAPTEVTVAYEPTGLTVTVRDRGEAARDAGRDGTGRGLLGLHERVALYSGHFDAGRQPDGGYRIRAHFPDEAS